MTAEFDKIDIPARKELYKSPLAGLEGIYLGIAPSDESDTKMGEVELTITDTILKFRTATGMEILEEEIELAETDLTEMTEKEIKELFETPEAAEGVRAFAAEMVPVLVFTDDTTDEMSVRMLNIMSDHLGPTTLFTPKQLERGLMEKAVREINNDAAYGKLPRLANNGLSPQD